MWRGTTAIQLTPKAFALLWYFVQHPGRILSKDERLQAVWPGISVSEGALTVCISELRKALGETARAPQYLETVHRLGYRCLGPVTAEDPPETTPPSPVAAASLVGRQAALAHLHACLVQACAGTRQVVFVSGEPGIGKTTLVNHFMTHLATPSRFRMTHGQCIEHYGMGEPYLPILDALGRLCRAPEGQQVVEIVRQYAPTWLLQLPGLLSAAEAAALQPRVVGATPARMLREFGEALDVLTRERPCVLVLEDLHWSDAATLDLLAWIAPRREPAQLLLLGTYRPFEASVHTQPLQILVQTLTLRGQGSVLPLSMLTEQEVTDYLRQRLGDAPGCATLAQTLSQQTSGNPLFMVTVLETLVHQGAIPQVAGQWQVTAAGVSAAQEVPESLRRMIAQQLLGLDAADQAVLAAASVAGMTCSAAAVAASVGVGVEQVEAQCARLVHHGQFLRTEAVEPWPDGTVAECYSFRHALCQQVVYAQITAARCRRLHQQIGLWLEAAYGAQGPAHAAELADHFVRGGDTVRAVRYRQQAGANAMQRLAYVEACTHLTEALQWLQHVPEDPRRLRQEMTMQLMLGAAVAATQSPAAPAVGTAYTRAQELALQLGDLPQLWHALRGLQRRALVCGELEAVQTSAEHSLRLAEQEGQTWLLAEAHTALGALAFHRGQLALAREHLQHGWAVDDRQLGGFQGVTSGLEVGVLSLVYDAIVLCFQGLADQALRQIRRALTQAQARAHPYTLTVALCCTALIHALRRAWPEVMEHACTAMTLATIQGYTLWRAHATILHGCALAAQGQAAEGLAQMQHGLAEARATGQVESRVIYLLLLAERSLHADQRATGLDAVTEALTLVQRHGFRAGEAELYRLRGQLLLLPAPASLPGASAASAEASLQQALTVARAQGAKAWELRAAISLARLWQQRGQPAEAYALLASVYQWFREGLDTGDLQEARGLLQELEPGVRPGLLLTPA